MRHLASYIITRILLAVPMVFIMLTLVFVVLRIMPGDPVSSMLGGHAPEKVIEQKKKELGLDRPIAVQYVEYLGKLIRLDLGESMIFKQKVSQPIIEKLPATLELTLFGLLASLGIGIPLGRVRGTQTQVGRRLCRAAVRQRRLLHPRVLARAPAAAGLRRSAGWFPISGRTGPRIQSSGFSWSGFYLVDTLRAGNFPAFADVLWHLVLPALTLGVVLSGIFVRLTRANMLDVLKSDYILAARARGIPERRVVYDHGLRNALIPIVTMLGLQFSLLLAGAILTESTFSWPGHGQAAAGEDLPAGLPHDPGGDRRVHPLRERHVSLCRPAVRRHRPEGKVLSAARRPRPAGSPRRRGCSRSAVLLPAGSTGGSGGS